MRYFIIILILALSLIIPLGGTGLQSGQFFNSALAQPPPPEKPWTVKTVDGSVFTKEELDRILANHKKWLLTDGKEGEKADLSRAQLRGAKLSGANLFQANLSEADLSGADLSDADLSGVTLWMADLSGAKLRGANLKAADFEPDPDKLPKVYSIAEASGLANLSYVFSSQSLVKLRHDFKEAGYRQQDWEISCSLKRSDTWHDWQKGDIASKIKAAFNYVFMDLTCNYGISPWRPLFLFSILIFIFSPFYWLALKSRRADTGIWVSWLPNRVLLEEGQEKPVKLTTVPPFDPPARGWCARVCWQVRKFWRILRLGLFFSLVSAFSLGLKELHLGNWISRLQKKEYILRPTGWVRTVAGIQSLISFFLLALWAFLYVGSIFESK